MYLVLRTAAVLAYFDVQGLYDFEPGILFFTPEAFVALGQRFTAVRLSRHDLAPSASPVRRSRFVGILWLLQFVTTSVLVIGGCSLIFGG